MRELSTSTLVRSVNLPLFFYAGLVSQKPGLASGQDRRI